MCNTLIGPLTAEEWCSFRLSSDDSPDVFYCCSNTSALRDALFDYLRMGGDDHMWDSMLIEVLKGLESHGGLRPVDPRILKLCEWCDFDPKRLEITD